MKFGGASLNDAGSVRNMAEIIKSFNDELVLVVSAMGKTTRAFHQLVNEYFNSRNYIQSLENIYDYHFTVINELFENNYKQVFVDFEEVFGTIHSLVKIPPSENFDFEYDKLVSYGEIISSIVVSHYLRYSGIELSLVDIRKILKSDSTHRDAKIDWEKSENLIKLEMDFNKSRIFLTQGFIASDENGNTTTLGLEGSDFTAAILSYILDANQMFVWKDVAGFFNSDPKKYSNVIKLDAISYSEAVELAYYGAKVIHPKTIKPLQNKKIPLWVKSFKAPGEPGTVITDSTSNKSGVEPEVPVFISKDNQILISIAPNDFSFIEEENLYHIFSILSKFRIKVNLMQNSAISFSICVDNDSDKIIPTINSLMESYKILYNEGLVLITIRHYNSTIINDTTYGRKIYLQQKSRHTARFVVK